MHDPVTGKPSSHAVLWMESNQRALDLVQVHVKIVAMAAGLLTAIRLGGLKGLSLARKMFL